MKGGILGILQSSHEDFDRALNLQTFIENPLQKCNSEHEICVVRVTAERSQPPSFTPTRLIDVHEATSYERVLLYIPRADTKLVDGLLIRYLALSHCWRTKNCPDYDQEVY
jgi:hypothetical protein